MKIRVWAVRDDNAITKDTRIFLTEPFESGGCFLFVDNGDTHLAKEHECSIMYSPRHFGLKPGQKRELYICTPDEMKEVE